MNIKFNVDMVVYKEDMVGPIPVSVEARIHARAEYQYEKPEYRCLGEPNEGYPGDESVTLLNIQDVVADVEWYTPAPDGTMTVYHSLSFTLREEAAAEWLAAWKVDVQEALDLEELDYDDIMG